MAAGMSAVVLASLLAGGAWVSADNAGSGEPLVIDGHLRDTSWQVDYVIPENAPEKLVLDGRDMMDALLKRFEYNDAWPGSWVGAYLTLRNESPYYYKVTDVSFQLDHTQKQEESEILKDLEYNPYEIGRGWHGSSRPSKVKAYSTGAVGFDGYHIPGYDTVTRAQSDAAASF